MKDSATITRDKPKKALVINPFGIGDVLFTTPVIKALKKSIPDIQLSFWCNERVQQVLRNNPRIEKIFPLSRGDLNKIFDESTWEGIKSLVSLFKKLRGEKFDLALDFSLDHRYSMVCWLAGIKRRIGFDYKGRGIFLTDKVEFKGYSEKHMVEYYLGLLKPLNITCEDKNIELHPPAAGVNRISRLLSYSGVKAGDLVVGIAPGAGASWGRDAGAKHWQPLKFAQLAERMMDELKAKVVILGDESEKPIAEIVKDAMRDKPVDLVGRTSLEELAAAISLLKVLVTNDGGPLHMATGLGVKTVSIFGPVDEKVYGPYPTSDKHIVVKKDLGCRPCYKDFRLPFCDKDRECIKDISVDEVFSAVRRVL